MTPETEVKIVGADSSPGSAASSRGSAASSTYRVTLEVFEGPLNLLLRLIECQELDITQVSLAAVADQYLAHVARLQEASAADLADFLVVAAKLLVIKSRSLLPIDEEEPDDPEEEDVGEDLAQQLLEYKRFKEVANNLREIEAAGLRTFTRVAHPPQVAMRLQPGVVTLTDLLEAYNQVLADHPPEGSVDGVVTPLRVSLFDCIKAIRELLRGRQWARFSSLIRRARSRTEIVVSFLAVLEMVKQQRLRVTQEHLFGEIYLEEREPSVKVSLPDGVR